MIALYSGPTTMAPTMRICELVNIPTAPISPAMAQDVETGRADGICADFGFDDIPHRGDVTLNEAVPGGWSCLVADGRIHRLDGDRAAPVTGEGLQLAEHDVGRAGQHIELHGVAVRPSRGSGEHDHVGDAGVCQEHIHKVLSPISRANQADMKGHR